MDVYRIEKSRIPVIVTLADGEELAGDMFAQGYAELHYGPERPSDILNDPHEYFPLALSDAETLLISKQNVREVNALSSSRDDWRLLPAWRQQRVDVRLASGEICSGTVDLEVPSDQPRLLDFLNRMPEQFLTVLTTAGARLINRRFIVSLRPLD
jgi:CRP-like cAMP-binding protein